MAHGTRPKHDQALYQLERSIAASRRCAPRLGACFAANASRIFLKLDRPDLALERFEGFSEFSPLHTASEARLLAEIHRWLGDRAKESHWRKTADGLTSRFGLENVFRRWECLGWVAGWSFLPLTLLEK